MTTTQPLYIAKTHPFRKYNYILAIITAGIFIVFGFQAIYGNVVFFVSVIIIILLIIYIIFKFDGASDNIYFNDNNVTFFKNGSKQTLDYSLLTQIKFVDPFKNRPYVKIIIDGSKYVTDIERNGGKDVIKKDFVKFIFTKNPTISVLEHSNFQEKKYFMLKGEVHTVEI